MTRSALASGRRYARALLDVSEAQGVSAKVDADLAQAVSVLGGSEPLRRALTHPAVPIEKKKAITKALFGSAEDLVWRFLDILIEHDRIDLLSEIATSFHTAWNAKRGVTSAEAISAVPLDPAQTQGLEKALAKSVDRTVELKTKTDPALLGGLLVKMGGRTYDGSVRSHLKALREALGGGSGTPTFGS
jgi:F-type H+-transporting ATPase subunit delta